MTKQNFRPNPEGVYLEDASGDPKYYTRVRWYGVHSKQEGDAEKKGIFR